MYILNLHTLLWGSHQYILSSPLQWRDFGWFLDCTDTERLRVQNVEIELAKEGKLLSLAEPTWRRHGRGLPPPIGGNGGGSSPGNFENPNLIWGTLMKSSWALLCKNKQPLKKKNKNIFCCLQAKNALISPWSASITSADSTHLWI